MKLLSVLILLVAYLQLSQAWVLEVHGKKKKKDGTRYSQNFHSRMAKDDCHNFGSRITAKGVDQFRFCTIQMYMCEIQFFDDAFCTGKPLGHNGARGYSWHKAQVSKKGSKMKSFRVSGCMLGKLPIVEYGKMDRWLIRDC